jgi:hypothetical protein
VLWSSSPAAESHPVVNYRLQTSKGRIEENKITNKMGIEPEEKIKAIYFSIVQEHMFNSK